MAGPGSGAGPKTASVGVSAHRGSSLCLVIRGPDSRSRGPLLQPPAPPSGGRRAPGWPRPHRPRPAQQDTPPRAPGSEFRMAPPPEVSTSCSLRIGPKERRAGPRSQITARKVLRELAFACSPYPSREGPTSPLFMSQLLGRASLTSSVPWVERLLVNICLPLCKLQEAGSCTRRILPLPEHRADARTPCQE